MASADVYATIIDGMNFVPSIGVSGTYYVTSQINWTYGPANMTFLPPGFPFRPLEPQWRI